MVRYSLKKVGTSLLFYENGEEISLMVSTGGCKGKKRRIGG
jgi:hypothetical protein